MCRNTGCEVWVWTISIVLVGVVMVVLALWSRSMTTLRIVRSLWTAVSERGTDEPVVGITCDVHPMDDHFASYLVMWADTDTPGFVCADAGSDEGFAMFSYRARLRFHRIGEPTSGGEDEVQAGSV